MLATIKMDEKIIEILKEFGLALVEKQHQFFVDEGIDNSEHIPAIKRIASTSYQYLTAKGVNPKISAKVKKDLLNHARELFIKEWMTPLDEDEEPLDEEEARRTFDQCLKKKND
ncbi:MAG: hypothetical protein COZ31_09970 [Nitrospirae bacterium CG_4_10_14_3_um_filter_44_29]|nr:hypothetical protein [Nitrospirota bacterium]OIO29928.1 MAG: hypothetical protein AUJ60_03985 [Nitrospirae bacterium CG1_02_44_142]PIP70615.1 MAG: hypothetical protein COW90_04470 [Nitrospirae bacterium CG22_combo_CG10-13_8_21_14_all_44_11]PIV41761.1 MAG: hypothetical protein COS28_04565 [Nitrospirae bacterium CG02_land_8_20_14_3_00_44_33]PIV66544.1 MAG: hypothetical protein COS10_05805 [Nitrospirae bacterium CG01_land_8_20_14_3_00_44_22]PIW90612.1 MAG: hypothetical protein COZ93_00960 [Nit